MAGVESKFPKLLVCMISDAQGAPYFTTGYVVDGNTGPAVTDTRRQFESAGRTYGADRNVWSIEVDVWEHVAKVMDSAGLSFTSDPRKAVRLVIEHVAAVRDKDGLLLGMRKERLE